MWSLWRSRFFLSWLYLSHRVPTSFPLLVKLNCLPQSLLSLQLLTAHIGLVLSRFTLGDFFTLQALAFLEHLRFFSSEKLTASSWLIASIYLSQAKRRIIRLSPNCLVSRLLSLKLISTAKSSLKQVDFANHWPHSKSHLLWHSIGLLPKTIRLH